MDIEKLMETVGGSGRAIGTGMGRTHGFPGSESAGGVSRAIFRMKDGKVESKEWEDTRPLTKGEIDGGKME